MSFNFKGQNVPAKFVTTTGKSPWHTTHTHIGEDCKYDLRLALERAGEDYDVIKEPLTNPFTGEPLETCGLFRSDNKSVFYGECRSRYEPVNNHDTLKVIFDIMSDNRIGIESMAFWNTGHVGANFLIDESEIVKDDKIVHYVQAIFGHDGKTTINYSESSVRIVCSNTLNRALKSASALLTARHTKNVTQTLNNYGLIINGIREEISTYKDRLRFLATKKLNVAQVTKILDTMYGDVKILKSTGDIKNNKRQQILELFEYNDGGTISGIKNSAYAFLNAITNHSTHKDRVTIQGEYDKDKRDAIEASRRILNNMMAPNTEVIQFMDIVAPMIGM